MKRETCPHCKEDHGSQDCPFLVWVASRCGQVDAAESVGSELAEAE